MRNRINRRSRRLETPSPEREVDRSQVRTPVTSNATLTNVDVESQEGLGDNNLENQLTEPSPISNEEQVSTQMFEQKSNDSNVRENEGRNG